VNDKPPSAARQSVRRLKTAGIVVLLLGLTAAALVYWLGTRDRDLSGDLSMQDYNKAEQRQMALLYGKSGLMMNDWLNDLKQPGTQAWLILATAGILTAGCFYFAWLVDEGDEPSDEKGSPHG
jgi:hypothetical protein